MQIDIQQIKTRLGIVGRSPALDHAIGVAAQVAPTDMSVLIVGESGVGKESFPKIIHQNSQRKHGPYIAVNCGAIPEGTIDSELFGHLKGSFTGAITDRKGYFQEASGGTIFLDEVGELPLSTQARLLRVLETGEFIPVGASQPQKTDVRIVAATNVNLRDAVARGRFREDLLYRLNTVPIQVPPLRQRREDIHLLFRLFASQNSDRYGMPPLRLTDEGREVLESYNWPGNIRELRNLTDRISILEEEREVSAETIRSYLQTEQSADYRPALVPVRPSVEYPTADLQAMADAIRTLQSEVDIIKKALIHLTGGSASSNISLPHSLTTGEEVGAYVSPPNYSTNEIPHTEIVDYEEPPVTLDEVERQAIVNALRKYHGRRKKAAEELNISERTLYRKIKDYGLDL